MTRAAGSSLLGFRLERHGILAGAGFEVYLYALGFTAALRVTRYGGGLSFLEVRLWLPRVPRCRRVSLSFELTASPW